MLNYTQIVLRRRIIYLFQGELWGPCGILLTQEAHYVIYSKSVFLKVRIVFSVFEHQHKSKTFVREEKEIQNASWDILVYTHVWRHRHVIDARTYRGVNSYFLKLEF